MVVKRTDYEEGRFGQDLYERLNSITIHIPLLRERPEDLELYFNLFLKESDCTYL